jgi:hypothetical protein
MIRAPAAIGRVLLLLSAGSAPALLGGPPGTIAPPSGYVQLGAPDQAKGRDILERLRSSGFASGDYYLEFELRQMPRRGAETVYHGKLWGGSGPDGPAMRISLADNNGGARTLLVRNGPRAAAWSRSLAGGAEVDGAALLAPLVDGVELTAFDLQMPFLYWPDERVVGLDNVLGRPAYAFLFDPPASFAASAPGLAAVRAYLDAEYGAPVKIETLGSTGRVSKTISLIDLKKVDGQWIVKEFDARNEVTRDKTRFELTGACLGLAFAPSALSPAALAEAPPAVPAGRIVRFGP